MTYPGGKAGAGVYQTIINQMPPHERYIEAFLGAGAVLLRKRPATCSIAIERDSDVITTWHGDEIPNLKLVHADALDFLSTFIPRPGDLLYCDPPYLRSTRASPRQLYAFEMTIQDHERLLEKLLTLSCFVMISGYSSELYADKLKTWRTISYRSVTRGHTVATEWLWMNYPEPLELHDYRYLGKTFRERERIKRKSKRWAARIAKMPMLERRVILLALHAEGSHTLQASDDSMISTPKTTIVPAQSATIDDAARQPPLLVLHANANDARSSHRDPSISHKASADTCN